MTNELPGSTVKSLARKPEQRPRSSRESSLYLLALNQLSSSQKGLPAPPANIRRALKQPIQVVTITSSEIYLSSDFEACG
jgi:hypothetical protein